MRGNRKDRVAMSNYNFRLLRADEIDLRVGTVGKKGASLLLYKDARCDMNVLDATVGEMNWQRRHTRDNNNCIVSIWDDQKACWVEKEDVGTESNTAKEKGLASDSFKRACVCWGIGRELYTAPFIFIPCATEAKTVNGKTVYSLADRYFFDGWKVSDIEYDEEKRVITELVICDKYGEVQYEYRNGRQKKKKEPVPEPKKQNTKAPAETPTAAPSAPKRVPGGISQEQIDEITNLCLEFNIDIADLMRRFKCNSLAQVPAEYYGSVVEWANRLSKGPVTDAESKELMELCEATGTNPISVLDYYSKEMNTPFTSFMKMKRETFERAKEQIERKITQ